MQYNLYTVSVTNGSNTVTGATGTKFLSKVKAGHSFKVKSDPVVYTIASVVSDTVIHLSVPYEGSTASNVPYQITTDFTSNFGFAEINVGDQDWPIHLTQETIRKIDEVLGYGMAEGIVFKGEYNALTSSPPLPSPSMSNLNWMYKVTVSGNGYSVGDSIISNGSAWLRIPIPINEAVIAAEAAATSANTAKLAAEAARDQALTAFDNFDDRYLGQFATNPTVDNDGNPLLTGALYFNTAPIESGGGMKVYSGTSWVSAYASLDSTLTSIAAVITAADKLIYFTGVDQAATTTITSFGRTIIGATSATNAGLVDTANDQTIGGVKSFTSTILAGVGSNLPLNIRGLFYASGATLPAITGTTQTAGLRIGNANHNAVFDIGQGTSSEGYGTWLQATNSSSLGVYYPLLVNPRGGNLLVGTAVDDGVNKLQVSGSVKITPTTANTGLNFAQQSGSRTLAIAVHNSNYARIFTDGTSPLVINEFGGSLLVGTTTDDGVNKLQVNGKASFSDDITMGVSKLLVRSGPMSGGVNIGDGSGWYYDFLGGGYTLVRVADSGRVLVGTTTDDGVNKLQVNGGIKATAQSTIDTSGFAYHLLLKATTETSRAYAIGIQSGAAFDIYDTADAASRFRINSTGNISIGTTADDGVNRLQVSGSAKFSSSSACECRINSTTTSANLVLQYNNTDKYTLGYVPGSDLFSIGRSGIAYDVNVKNGNLLVGTVSDLGYKLFVNGDVRCTNLFFDGGTKLYATSEELFIQVNGGVRGKWSANGNLLINTTIDDGVNKLQVNGGIAYTGTLTGGTGVINIGSGQFYKDASGNVGIGIIPTAKLHIAGNLLKIESLVAGAGALIQGIDPHATAKTWRIGHINDVSALQFSVDSVNSHMALTSTGNLLVGTTADDGVNKLQVNGNISAAHLSVTNTNGITLSDNAVGGFLSYGFNSGRTNVAYHAWYNGISSELMRLTPAGNLLVGTTADDTTGKLQVAGKISAVGYANSNGAYDAFGASILTGYPTFGFRQQLLVENAASNTYGWGLLTTLAGTSTEKLRVTGTGNLLIGTTTDDGVNRLQVAGGASFAAAGATAVTVGRTDGYQRAKFTGTTGATGNDCKLEIGSTLLWYGTSAGNLLIGTTADDGVNKLQVGGTAKANGFAFPASQVASADPNTLDDYEEGNWTATIGCDGGSITLNSSYNTLRYTKIGRLVTVTGYIKVQSVSSPTGNIAILGLPIQSGATLACGGAVAMYGVGLTSNVAISGRVAESATSMLICTPNQQPASSLMQANSEIFINGSYTV